MPSVDPFAPFDLLIAGGRLVDGTGAAAREGELGIRDGRIAAVGAPGQLPRNAARTLDASGRVVAPGFIDVHTHYDLQVLWDRMLTISPWHGVTSVVMGNCGFGVAPTRPEHRDLILRTLENVEGMSLDDMRAGVGDEWPFETFPEYLDAIDRRGTAINVAAMIGHTPIRMYVMGDEATERAATADEIAEMKRIAKEALDAGAIGVATSKSPTHVGYAGRPVPSRAAELGEIHALADALGEAGHGVLQATIGAGFFLNELAEIQQRSGRPVSWTALLSGMLGPGGEDYVLGETTKLAKAGTLVVPQVSCRPLMFEFQWKAPFPFESMSLFKPISAAEDIDAKMRIYADPSFREAFKRKGDAGGIAGRWDQMVLSEHPHDAGLGERNIAELAAERGVEPVDLVLDIALETKLEARFRIAAMNTDEAIVGTLLNHPHTMLGLSDAGAHASQLCDACAPTHLLGHWVRERGDVSLEHAVHLLTGRAAEIFGLDDRGRLAEGLAADVTIFDAETVGCSPLARVHDQPAGGDRLVSEAFGIEAVIVNGLVIRERGQDTFAPDAVLPGRVLRGGKSS
jgi:N-acyl-D-aspartate/D-glutamate deacylase